MWSEWLKLDNLKWLLQTAAIPVTLAIISQQYQSSQTTIAQQYQDAQTTRQAHEARLRLYTELLSKREDADTGVRRGIFDKVVEKYLQPQLQNLDEKLVALELLAVNFNDSLDLSPLFWQLDRDIQNFRPADKRNLLAKQLERVVTQVKDRQIELLQFVGDSIERKVQFRNEREAELDEGTVIRKFSFSEPGAAGPNPVKITRNFRVYVAEHDPSRRRVLVGVDGGERQWMFWVDVFDFPLVNFTRISKSERFAVVLKRYRPPTADLAVIYFPSSRSGVKDKPFIDEVISSLHGGKSEILPREVKNENFRPN